MKNSKAFTLIFLAVISCGKSVNKPPKLSTQTNSIENKALKSDDESTHPTSELDTIIFSALELYNNTKDSPSLSYSFAVNAEDLSKKIKTDSNLDSLQNILIYFKSDDSIFYTLTNSKTTQPIDMTADYFHFSLSGDSTELRDYIKTVRLLKPDEAKPSDLFIPSFTTGKALYSEAIDLIPKLNIYAVLCSQGKVSNRKKDLSHVYILDSKDGLLKKVEEILQTKIFNAKNDVAVAVNQLDQLYGNEDFLKKANRQFISGATPSRKVLERISKIQTNKEQREALNYFIKLQSDLENFNRLKKDL